MSYPLDHRALYYTPRVGFEPTTLRLTAGCSTAELSRISSQPPLTFPSSPPLSIISRLCLNRRVRNGYGCAPQTYRHWKSSLSSGFPTPSKLNTRYIIAILSPFVNTFSIFFFSYLFHLGQALGLLVLVSLIHYCTYTSNLSTSSSSRDLTHLRFGISYLEGGFTLRCLQRLSRPYLATQLCSRSATGTPVVCPFRSSRTKNSSSQISCAHNG